MFYFQTWARNLYIFTSSTQVTLLTPDAYRIQSQGHVKIASWLEPACPNSTYNNRKTTSLKGLKDRDFFLKTVLCLYSSKYSQRTVNIEQGVLQAKACAGGSG